MAITSEHFLERACSWAFEHGTLFIDDDEFLPELEREGVSDALIIRLKTDLERRGAIENHHVVGGMRDFRLNRATFLQHARRRIGDSKVCEAQALFNTWQRSPDAQPFTSDCLAAQLNVPEQIALSTRTGPLSQEEEKMCLNEQTEAGW